MSTPPDEWSFPRRPIADRTLTLLPLEREHLGRAAPVVLSPGTWFYETRGIRTPADLAVLFERNLNAREQGTRVPWLVTRTGDGEVLGITAWIAPNPEHRTLEIGGTWIGLRWQRTYVNTALKRLMLAHCFENLRCARVSFKVDCENLRSQRAMERIGAQFEGVQRHGWVLSEGRDRRNLKIYSILEAEWPQIEARLRQRLENPETSSRTIS